MTDNFARFNERGGIGSAHNLFGLDMGRIIDDLNEALAR